MAVDVVAICCNEVSIQSEPLHLQQGLFACPAWSHCALGGAEYHPSDPSNTTVETRWIQLRILKNFLPVPGPFPLCCYKHCSKSPVVCRKSHQSHQSWPRHLEAKTGRLSPTSTDLWSWRWLRNELMLAATAQHTLSIKMWKSGLSPQLQSVKGPPCNVQNLERMERLVPLKLEIC